MNDNFSSKLLLNTVRKFFKISSLTTPNIKNTELAQFNGSTELTKSGQYNLLLNGSATLGSPNHKTHFTGLIVVNGNVKTMNASFDSLEINGSGNLETTEVRGTLHVNGKTTLKNSNINSLKTYGDYTKIKLINSIIQKEENIQERTDSTT
jgi:hypothetical protein